MKRLNNKGITIVEILLCFVLASLITTSLYNIIETISQAKQNEQAKYQMETQRAYLTKEVLGDIIEDGLSAVTINGSKKDVAKSVTDTPLNLYSSSCKVFDSDTWTCSDSDNYDTEANRKAPNKFYAPATSAILIRFLFKDGTIKELRILKQVNNYKIKTAGGFSTTYGDKFQN